MNSLTQDIRTADAAGRRVGFRGWLALAVLMLPVLLVSVDNTVLSFALPAIATSLEPTTIQQLWIIDVYPLVLAGMLVTMGTLGDRFGRRRMLMIGATGFAVISAAAAFAPSAEWLIVGRAAMGIFGAMLMPSTLSLLRSIFTDRQQRRLAIAIWASMFSAGTALGPIVGGILLEHFAWGSVFLMAVPVLIPLLVLVPILVPESRDPDPGRIDALSILLSLATMVPIVYAIKEIAIEGLLSPAPILFVVGAGFGVLFVRRQLRLSSPMLDMRLFRYGAFSGGLLVNLLSIMTYVGFLLVVSQHLQLIVGLSPINAGLVLVPGLITTVLAGLVIVPISRRVAARVSVPISLTCIVVGFLLIAMSTTSGDIGMLMFAFAIVGVGLGSTQTIANDLILASAPPNKAGAASAVSETAYEVGAVLGTSALGGILSAMYRTNLDVPAAVPAEAAAQARETLAGAESAAANLDPVAAEALRHAAATAFDGGMATTSYIAAGLAVAAGVIAATTLGRSRSSKPE